MYSERAIHGLIPLIYDAAVDRRLWPDFLNKFADLLHSEIATLYAQDLNDPRGRVAAAVGIDPAHQRAYEERYAKKNIFFVCGKHLLISGAVCTSDMMCPDRGELKRSEFYNDFMVPLGMDDGLNGVIFKERDWTGMIGVIRGKRRHRFHEKDLEPVRLLMPHLQRGFQLQGRLARIESEHTAAIEALNCWPIGVVLLDQNGKVLLMNRTAETIANQRDGLEFVRGELCGVSANETLALHKLIMGAVQPGLLLLPGGATTLNRPSLKRPLQLLVAPASRNASIFSACNTAAVVFVHDPEAVQPVAEDVLHQVYGLTAAETETAVLLVQGKDVHEISDELHVTRETPRMHLKHIFDKTGTRRQSELVNLVLRGPASLRRAG
jgi:DNA-binding CsgD family transcriptional regulator